VEVKSPLPMESLREAPTKRARMELAKAHTDNAKALVADLIQCSELDWNSLQGSSYGILTGSVEALGRVLGADTALANHPEVNVLPNRKFGLQH